MEQNGWVQAYANASSVVSLDIGGFAITYTKTPANSSFTYPPIPVKKGDVVTLNITSGSGRFTFFPMR